MQNGARWSLDAGAELRKSVKEMIAKRGTKVVVSPVISARMKSGLIQSRYAELLGVSVRTLQEWEQGRRSPSKSDSLLKPAWAATAPNPP